MRTDTDRDVEASAGLGDPAPTHLDPAVPDRAGQTHLWFMADSPAGPVFVAHCHGWVSGLLIASNGRWTADPDGFVDYMHDEVGVDAAADPDPDHKLVTRVNEALAEGRTDVPVDLSSRSPFHQEVLRATTRIPHGEVRTYGELASIVGRPRAARAVGTAMARNPVPLLVPCHRVVPSSGGVGKYGYGSDLKAKLLASEGAVF